MLIVVLVTLKPDGTLMLKARWYINVKNIVGVYNSFLLIFEKILEYSIAAFTHEGLTT